TALPVWTRRGNKAEFADQEISTKPGMGLNCEGLVPCKARPACTIALLRYPARMDNPFVTTEWLAARLDDARTVIVDASWYLPTANRRPYEEYLAGHIPGAIYFDMDEIVDKSTSLPHMLLAPAEFEAAAGALGIGDGMTIVVYDEAGLFS